jgi:hypothetical protein
MNFMKSQSIFGAVFATACLALLQPAAAEDVVTQITESQLREVFVFDPDDRLKHSECADKTYPTCTYVWGRPSKKDATRISMGLAPNGNQLKIIYAQGRSARDFERSISVYSDAEPTDNLGIASVWSAQRQQLSFVTGTFLIVHVNVQDDGNDHLKETAMGIAKFILANE